MNARRFEYVSRLFWTGLLSAAATAHLLVPEWFVAYYPSYMPLAHEAVTVSALCELALASMLWLHRTRHAAWLAISMLMLLYVPVHVYVITHHSTIAHPTLTIPLWLAWLRLPAQGALIVWPWRCAQV